MRPNPSADPSICARCASLGPTCCTTVPGREEFCFPLSDLEKERIQDLLPQGGFVLQENTEGFIAGVARLFPGEEALVRVLFPPRRQHFRLALDQSGRCRFLGAEGCLIPREIRPYYCRLFPFWMSGTELSAFDAPECLARKGADGVAVMLQRVEMTGAQVRDLYGRLRLAWGLSPGRGLGAVKKGF